MQTGLPKRAVWSRMQSKLLSKVRVLSMEKRQREQNPEVTYLSPVLGAASSIPHTPLDKRSPVWSSFLRYFMN